MSDSLTENYYHSERPEVAMITNHGYAGAAIPTGGAPDTGGQNYYVNTEALKFARLGYQVTIFSRGGFPYFQSDRIRSEAESLSRHVRYIFVPGGGDSFIRKEDIATALDEEVEWLDQFIRQEAKRKDCRPWQVYEFINSHYWDAAVLGVRLIERWRNDRVAHSMHRLLDGIIEPDSLAQTQRWKHWRAMGEVPGFHLGRLLIHREKLRHLSIRQQVRAAASSWASAKRLDARQENHLVDSVLQTLSQTHEEYDKTLKRLLASAALGQAILSQSPDADEQLKRDLDRLDRHVWTPHSLGELKDYNYRNRPLDARRSLKFCERRSHERMVATRTRAFAATSVKIAERLWTHYRVPIEDTFYFPPCIDTQVFRPYDQQEALPTYRYLSEISGISVDRLQSSKIVFETSRMDRTKRKDLLLAAFARIAPQMEGVYLFIGGGPPNELFQMLNQQVEFTEALEGRAFLTGAIPDEHIGPLFSIAHVYATASEMEGFGMCVSQAAAAGTLIASSDVIPFSIHHASQEIEIFPTGDTVAFTEAIRLLLELADQECIKRCNRLRESVVELDWEVKVRQFINYLRQRGIDVADGVMKE